MSKNNATKVYYIDSNDVMYTEEEVLKGLNQNKRASSSIYDRLKGKSNPQKNLKNDSGLTRLVVRVPEHER